MAAKEDNLAGRRRQGVVAVSSPGLISSKPDLDQRRQNVPIRSDTDAPDILQGF